METVIERFLRYVSYDTQSDESGETCPSTAKQKLLGQALVEEMLSMGIADAHMDQDGYVGILNAHREHFVHQSLTQQLLLCGRGAGFAALVGLGVVAYIAQKALNYSFNWYLLLF